MMSCHAVIILAGVYATYSKWINIEIDLAEEGFTYAKPIIAIRPWGSQRISERGERESGWPPIESLGGTLRAS